MAGYQEMADMQPIRLGGLYTNVTPIAGLTDKGRLVRNVDLRPRGGGRKRAGLLCIEGAAGTRTSPVPSGDSDAVEFAGALIRQSESTQYAIFAKGGRLSRWEVDGGSPCGAIHAGFQSGHIINSAMAPFSENDPTDINFLGECLYAVNGQDEPLIFTGLGLDQFADSTTSAGNSIQGGVAGNPIKVTVAAASSEIVDGNWVWLPGVTDGFDLISSQPWRIEYISGTEFYLLNYDGTRVTWPGTQSVINGPEVYFTPRAALRWPLGKYATDTTRQRGYPERWIDPEEEGLAGWPTGTPDWPSGIEYVGEGLQARMFAWGFDTDPDRIDYSELGVPYNFLKSDVDAADESSAASSPGVDGGFFYCRRGDGDRVVAVREFRGLIVVFKTGRTYIYSGTPGSDDWGITRTLDVGAVSDRSIVQAGNMLMFWSDDGPRSIQPADVYGDLLAGTLGYEILDEVDRVTGSARGKIHAVHDKENERVLWFAPADGGASPSLVFAYYYPATPESRGEWSVFDGRYAEMDSIAVFDREIVSSTKMVGGNQNGFAYQMNVGVVDDYDYNAESEEYDIPVPIEMAYETFWFSPGGARISARGLKVTFVYGDSGVGNLVLKYAWDFNSEWSEADDVLQLRQGAEGAYWDRMVWDEFTWDETGRGMSSRGLHDVGRILSLRIEDSGIYGLEILAIVLDLRMKGDRA